jgi:hypothetical protein
MRNARDLLRLVYVGVKQHQTGTAPVKATTNMSVTVSARNTTPAPRGASMIADPSVMIFFWSSEDGKTSTQ